MKSIFDVTPPGIHPMERVIGHCAISAVKTESWYAIIWIAREPII